MIDPEIQRYIDDRLNSQTHDGNVGSQRVLFSSIFGQIETVTTAPTAAPVGGSPYDQIKIYYDAGGGPAWHLYVYDYKNSVWKSTALT